MTLLTDLMWLTSLLAHTILRDFLLPSDLRRKACITPLITSALCSVETWIHLHSHPYPDLVQPPGVPFCVFLAHFHL